MRNEEDGRPLIAHVVFHFGVGGLENGVVNLINHLPREAYRHAVIALSGMTDFWRRIVRDDVQFISLHKEPGQTIWLYPRLWRLFYALKPAIVHSRNLAALEVLPAAMAAGVRVRIHGEHGRDVGDLDGSNRTYQWVRRCYSPFVTHFVALSSDLEQYLVHRVGVLPERVTQIYNGVDADRFFPPPGFSRQRIAGCPFNSDDCWLVGTVGRMQTVKNQVALAAAFARVIAARPDLRRRLRLVMVGDGPLRAQAQEVLVRAGVADLAWLPGERDDVPEVLRGLDCFVLPSLAEGVSNTILEAMASGLPVIATRVGGNAELVADGRTGRLVPADDVEALSSEIVAYADQPVMARAAGAAGREVIERRFGLPVMTEAYRQLYDRFLGAAGEAGLFRRRIGTSRLPETREGR